jgi:single-strand DNA-binding protein
MSTVIGKGNLGAKPALKYVDVKAAEEVRPVAEMRIYFDHRRPDGEGGFRDEGGFWADVTIWGRKAETAARLLPKGARVCVFGTLYKQRWTDRQTGQPREEDAILADDITLDLLRVEEIELRPAKEREPVAGSGGDSTQGATRCRLAAVRGVTPVVGRPEPPCCIRTHSDNGAPPSSSFGCA